MPANIQKMVALNSTLVALQNQDSQTFKRIADNTHLLVQSFGKTGFGAKGDVGDFGRAQARAAVVMANS